MTFHVWDDVAPLKRELSGGGLERVALVGAGLVGCELAEAFRSLWGIEVVLLEAAGSPLPQLLDEEIAATVAGHLCDQASGIPYRKPDPTATTRINPNDQEAKLN